MKLPTVCVCTFIVGVCNSTAGLFGANEGIRLLMENHLTSYRHDQHRTQLSVRSGHRWRHLPRMIFANCLAIPYYFLLTYSLMLTGIAAFGLTFGIGYGSLVGMFCGWVFTALLFGLMRVLLVPTGRFLRRGRLEGKIETTADRHQVVHLLVKLASINERLGRRVIAQYYRQSTATLSVQPVDRPLVPIPKTDVFSASVGGDGVGGFFGPNFGWLSLTPYHLAHEADMLCPENSRVVIRLEDICKVEVNRRRFQTPFMTIDFEYSG